MDSSGEVIYSGMLRKKGGRVNVWGERYFVLRGYTLYYYVKSTDSVRQYYHLATQKQKTLNSYPILLCNATTFVPLLNFRTQKDRFLCRPHAKCLPSHPT